MVAELKKVTKHDLKLKNLHFEEDVIIDEDGCIVDINRLLKLAYEDKYFDFSTTAKEEEILSVDTDDIEEE